MAVCDIGKYFRNMFVRALLLLLLLGVVSSSATASSVSASMMTINGVEYVLGDVIQYEITVSNPASSESGIINTVDVYNEYPDGTTDTMQTGLIQNPGDIVIYITQYIVTQADVERGEVTNTLKITGVDSTGDDIFLYVQKISQIDQIVIELPYPVHNINKGTDYTTIQAAIDDASPGDEIHVGSGTYYENVDVHKQLILRGMDTGAGMPVVDAGGSGSAITLNANGIELDGFTATNAGSDPYAGIKVISSYNTLIENIASNNLRIGIKLDSSSSNTLSNNDANSNYVGIFFNSSNANKLTNNNASSNSGTGITIGYSSNNTLTSNTARSNIGTGISISYSNNNTLTNNIASSNSYGFGLFSSSNNNTLTNNNASLNYYGISSYFSDNNTLTSNIASNNNYGIYLWSSSNYNAIYHNSLIDNTQNAYDTGTNQWDFGSEGNHYSDYPGTDSNGDGIGDTPYPIPGGSSVDNYPLMASYSTTPPPPTIQDKTLLQAEGQSEVYWLQNNKLYWVTDWDLIDQMSGIPGWDGVNTLPASEFDPAAYAQGPRFITTKIDSDGLLIRGVGGYNVYRIESGKKRHITHLDVMDLKGYSFDDVIEVSPDILDMFPLGDPIGIEIDLHFDLVRGIFGDIPDVNFFKYGDTVKYITETAVTENYIVETYVKVIFPDGVEKYAYYEESNFQPTDSLQFSSTERPLYPGTWNAQTKSWNWNEYSAELPEMEGTYTWIFWYKDVTSGKILGQDMESYSYLGLIFTDLFAQITAPSDGSIFDDGTVIQFSGDEVGGPYTPLVYKWISSIDGEISSTKQFNTILTPGVHTITLCMMDSIDFITGCTDITVTINEKSGGISVGQGASTPEITEAFNVAYDNNGGVTVVGNPTSAVYNKWGYEVQEFPGTDTYPGGIIIYNPDKSAAFYIHGDILNRYNALGGPVATTDKEFQLGIPTSDVLPYAHLDNPKISKYDTPYRHQNFESDNEKAALVHNLNSGKVVEIHGEIYKKWLIHGNLADGILGLVTEDEMKAGQSPQGKTGRYSKFENGTIHWNEQSGRAYITSGDLDKKYTSLDGTNHWLGFPVMDQIVRDGHEYSKFEGGHLFWDKVISDYRAVTTLIAVVPIKFLDTDEQSIPSIADLEKRTDYITKYYSIESYGKENIGFNIITSSSEIDGWHLIKENFDPVIMKCDEPDETILNCAARYYIKALELTELNLQYHNPPFSRIIGYDASMVVYPHYVISQFFSGVYGFYVPVTASYGNWAHEVGHLLKLTDMATNEKTGGDIGNWGLMGTGAHYNPPSPIINYNKNINKWVDWNDIESNAYGNYIVRMINDERIEDEGALRYKAKSGGAAYYIFEGRNPTDDIKIDEGFSKDIKLEEKEGIMVYQVQIDKGIEKIYSIPRDCKFNPLNLNPVCSILSDLDNKVTLLPDDVPGQTKYIANDEVKLTVFKENNELKIKIEEVTPYLKKAFDMTTYGIPIGKESPKALSEKDSYIDVDLNLISSDGKKIGMDYSSNIFYNQIEGAHMSGNIPGGGYEWISIPTNIDADPYVDLTPELKELIRNDNSINIEVISTLTLYDENGNQMESDPISMNINSENVDSPLMLSLPINIIFLPPIITMDQFSLTDGSTLPIKFTVRNSTTDEFIYDPTINVTITNSTGNLITYFTNGTDSVRINSEEEQYIVNFDTNNYDLNVGETYAITVTFGESGSLRGYDVTYFTLVDGDTTPPSSISNLSNIAGTTWITWNWTNPTDSDFNHTEIYLNGVLQTQTTGESFSANGLDPGADYTILTCTVDTSGNMGIWFGLSSTTSKPVNAVGSCRSCKNS